MIDSAWAGNHLDYLLLVLATGCSIMIPEAIKAGSAIIEATIIT